MDCRPVCRVQNGAGDTLMSRDINDLHPDLQQPCMDFFDRCKDADLKAFMVFTWRSPVEQDRLYEQGRTEPGPIVTNLKGDQSFHCFMLNGEPAAKAFDFGLEDENDKYITDGSDARYAQAGAIGENLGLTWGGDWKSFKDPSHLQLKD